MIWLPVIDTIFLCSASLWSKLVDATTIYYPTCQSTVSDIVRVDVFAATVVESVDHVLTRGVPYIENLHYMHPMPLFPNMGNCFPK